MRRIFLPAFVILCALCETSVAQQAAKPVAAQSARLVAPTPVETAQLRLALQKSESARLQLNQARARLKLPPLDVATINRTKVPLLAVVRPGTFANLRIDTTRDHFTVSGGDVQRGFILTGTKLAPSVARPVGIRTLKTRDSQLLTATLGSRGVVDPISDVEIVRTEDGYDISFRRYGAAYDLRMVCNAPDEDNCTKEEALKLLADTAVLGGGQ